MELRESGGSVRLPLTLYIQLLYTFFARESSALDASNVLCSLPFFFYDCFGHFQIRVRFDGYYRFLKLLGFRAS